MKVLLYRYCFIKPKALFYEFKYFTFNKLYYKLHDNYYYKPLSIISLKETVSKPFKHAFNPANPELLVSTMFLLRFPLCRYFINDFFPSLSHSLTLFHLSLIILLHILVPLCDYLFLHKQLSLLQLSVPLL